MNAQFDEVTLYITLIARLESNRTLGVRALNASQAMPILKASVFLMLYNLIEGNVRSVFSEIYSKIDIERLSFQQLSVELQKIWLKQQFDGVLPESANHSTYLSAFEAVAQRIEVKEHIALSSRKLPVSGNLDAQAVRKICKMHGFQIQTSKYAKGGEVLTIIKDKRNALAHGNQSFAECGREYAVADLKRMTKEVKHFVLGVHKSARQFQTFTNYRKAI